MVQLFEVGNIMLTDDVLNANREGSSITEKFC